MDKKKILIINTVGMGFEGISSVIVNYISKMNRTGLEIDFVVFPTVQKEFLHVLKPLGNVQVLPERKKDVKEYILALNRLMKKKYDVIHVHGNSGTMVIESVLARWNRIQKIIVHTHNTTCNHPYINKILTPIMKFTATDLLSCSVESGQWLYGKSKHLVLNNAIDIERFTYNPRIREAIRKELNLTDSYVIGHIGNFNEQKNHEYLVDVFYEVFHKNSSARLLMASDGPNLEPVKEQVTRLGIQNAVTFAGRRADVELLYQAMDVFVMPSRWEGLPLVSLEAQACGLPLLVSDRITEHIKCTKEVWFMSIDEKPEVWAHKIEEISGKVTDRKTGVAELMRAHNFDIVREAEKLRNLYMA